MPLTASFNLAASIANRQFARNDAAMTTSLAKLSAGTRVVSARDDAASLAIGARLNSDAQALKQAGINADQAASMAQIADGAMSRITDILVRMKTLAVQSSSGQMSGAERGMIDTEYTQLRDEIDRLAGDTEFNGQQLIAYTGAVYMDHGQLSGNLLAGTDIADGDGDANDDNATAGGHGTHVAGIIGAANDGSGMQGVAFDTSILPVKVMTTFEIRVGSGILASDRLAIELRSVSSYNLGLHTSTVATVSDANAAIEGIGTAIDRVATARAGVGAALNRLDFGSAQIATSYENLESARSALLDLDVASEMASFVSKQVLVQVGTSMAAQSNLQSRTLPQLLQ